MKVCSARKHAIVLILILWDIPYCRFLSFSLEVERIFFFFTMIRIFLLSVFLLSSPICAFFVFYLEDDRKLFYGTINSYAFSMAMILLYFRYVFTFLRHFFFKKRFFLRNNSFLLLLLQRMKAQIKSTERRTNSRNQTLLFVALDYAQAVPLAEEKKL